MLAWRSWLDLHRSSSSREPVAQEGGDLASDLSERLEIAACAGVDERALSAEVLKTVLEPLATSRDRVQPASRVVPALRDLRQRALLAVPR